MDNNSSWWTRFFEWVSIGVIVAAVVVDVLFILSLWWGMPNGGPWA